MDITLYKGINYCLGCGSGLLITKDRERKLRPVCPSCGWIYYKNPVPAVAAVVLNETGELLLIKRRYAPEAGEWALPSGYMEVTLSPEENVLEELLEETGLIGKISHCIGWHYGHSPLYHRILNIGFRICIASGMLQAGDDAVDVMYFPLSALPHIPFISHRKFINLETGSTLPLS